MVLFKAFAALNRRLSVNLFSRADVLIFTTLSTVRVGWWQVIKRTSRHRITLWRSMNREVCAKNSIKRGVC